MEKKKNIHEGHRKRLRSRFLKEGLLDFDPHNALELLLFYGIPRKDTNEIAHALLEKFGSIEGVLDTSIEELCEVPGVSENAAVLIKLIRDFAQIYYEAKSVSEVGNRYNYKSTGEMLVSKFMFCDEEKVYALFFDNSNRMISIDLLCDGGVNGAAFSFRTIAKLALLRKASSFALAHNHPKGVPIPSVDDIDTTRMLLDFSANMQLNFIEHFIVGGSKFSGIFHDGFLRKI